MLIKNVWPGFTQIILKEILSKALQMKRLLLFHEKFTCSMFMRNNFRVSGLLDKIKIAVTPELKINLKFNRGQFFLDNNKK